MSRFKRIKTGEAGEFWAFVDATAAEVDDWPEWKKVLFPEHSLPLVPSKAPSHPVEPPKAKQRSANRHRKGAKEGGNPRTPHR